MTRSKQRTSLVAIILIGVIVVIASFAIGWRFDQDIKSARTRAAAQSLLIATPCGRLEYQQIGGGAPLLVRHGGGGGHDQGIAFAGALAQHGTRVIAISRFGYLRAAMPADASPEAQADVNVCLLDALGIRQAAVLGGSAGAQSALQTAIRHPDRVSALLLLMPRTYKPDTLADSATPPSPRVEKIMARLFESDFVYWAGLHLARDQLIKHVLGTSPDLVASASAPERARVNALLDNVLPLSARAQGMRNDAAVGTSRARYPLELVRAPTLLISTRDDAFGTYAAAEYTAGQIAGARLIGYASGGHAFVGHDDEVRAEAAKSVIARYKP